MDKLIILVIGVIVVWLLTGAWRRRQQGTSEAAQRRNEQRTMRAWEGLHSETKRNTGRR